MEEIKEYDENNNLIYCKYSSGTEQWWKYDENNNEIHYKGSNYKGSRYEIWHEFDENNNLIYIKDSYGLEKWYKWENNEQIEITQKEFERIKRNKENIKNRELINNSKISRFELMEI